MTVPLVIVAAMWLKGRAGGGRLVPGSKKPEPALEVALITTLPVGPVKLIGEPEQVGVAGGGASRRATRTA